MTDEQTKPTGRRARFSINTSPPKEQVHTAPVQSPSDRSTRSDRVSWIFYIVSLCIILGIVLFGFQMYTKYRTIVTETTQSIPQVPVDDESVAMVKNVRRHMQLPEEEPQVLRVTEPEKYKDQPFYSAALVGDWVVAFSERAILYRPSIDKIIEIGFIRRIAPESEATASVQILHNQQ